VPERRTPYLLSTTLIPFVFVSVLTSGNRKKRRRTELEHTPRVMLKNFKKGFNGGYRVKLTLNRLRTFYEIDWPAFGVGWPSEGSLDKVKVNRVF
jgi:hypothetical protein